MRYRRLSTEDEDYVFGQGASEFLANSPATVAQAVMTRLQLGSGQWFLDLDEGTPYDTAILGFNKQTVYDVAIQSRILDTQGVQAINAYQSTLSDERELQVRCTISTIYGITFLAAPVVLPPKTGRLDLDFVLNESALA